MTERLDPDRRSDCIDYPAGYVQAWRPDVAPRREPSNGRRRPGSIDEAVDVLLAVLPEAQLQRLARDARDDLLVYHFGLGLWVRSAFGLWGDNPSLLEDCRNGTPEVDPDDAAMRIVDALWQRLQGPMQRP